MRWGIGSYAYAWSIGVPGVALPNPPMTAMGLLERCHHHGVALVEYSDNLPLGRLWAGELRAVIDKAAEWGMEIRLGVRGLVQELLEAYIALCQQTGSPTLRVVVDSIGYEPSPEDIVHCLHGIVPHLADAGVQILIENHDRLSSGALALIMEQIDSPWVGICLDPVNSFGALEGPEVIVETLKPWVRVVHVKDFAVGRIRSNMGFSITGVPVGKGQLNVPWLLESLDAERRDIAAVIELWPPYLASIEETAALEEDWVRQSVGYMRSLAG